MVGAGCGWCGLVARAACKVGEVGEVESELPRDHLRTGPAPLKVLASAGGGLDRKLKVDPPRGGDRHCNGGGDTTEGAEFACAGLPLRRA
jgi:hypothetical protein